MNFNFTNKQWIVGGAVALVLVGGGVGLVASNQHAKAEKVAQQVKIAHDSQVNAAKTAVEKAETFKAEADVKTAQDVVNKLDEQDKADLLSRVDKVKQNWTLVNSANKAVLEAEKAKSDATVKTGQTAIDKLKAEMTKGKKTEFQKRLDKVKAEVKAKKDKAEADKKAKAKAEQAKAAETKAQAQQTPPAQEAKNVASAPVEQAVTEAPADVNGQYAPAQEAPSYNTPAPATPPAHNGGGNVNSNIGLDEANDLDHASNGENPADGGR
ncbi:MAG: serine protease [Lactococcus garvieae]